MGVCTSILPTPDAQLLDKNTSIWDLFTNLEVLGKGQSSTVFKVSEIHNDTTITRRKFALKQMDRDKKSNNLMFENEVNFLSKNSHPNIVKYENAYIDENYFYICTEFLHGTNLIEMVNLFGHVPEKAALNIIRDILEAIQYCHQQNIVHRDLKLDNIIYSVNKADRTGKVVIIDWGNATVIDNNQFYGDIVGSPHYVSPEALRSRKGWEMKKSDMYAIGVITCALTTGSFPYSIQNNRDIFKFSRANINWKEFWDGCKVQLSKDCQKFIESLIENDTKKRMSVDEALNHSWLCSDR